LRTSTSIESTNKTKNLHRITEKGRKYKANPPAEIKAEEGTATPPGTKTVIETVIETVTKTSPPQPPATEEKSKTEKGDPAIPSQADLFRSIAEQLSISKQKDGTPLTAVVCYVERTADLDDLNSLWNAGQVY
jgi:hypothetical protein